jgi:hypothetical protein
MISVTYLVIYALAVFRLSEMLVIDDGMFDVFINIRGWFNKAPAGNGLRRTIANGLQCVHCVGVWFALLFSFCIFFPTPVTDFIITVLAVSGLQSIISNNLGRK